MRMTTKKESEMFDRLITISKNQPILVEEALFTQSQNNTPAKLEDVVQYIVDHRDNYIPINF